jgi:hypothetical protein
MLVAPSAAVTTFEAAQRVHEVMADTLPYWLCHSPWGQGSTLLAVFEK